MYFSKNSRYVLQKTHWLSKSLYFLPGPKRDSRNLGVKYPRDDPAKPALRVNIPKDQKLPELSYKFIRDSSNNGNDLTIQPRSRSLMARPLEMGSGFEEDFLPKCESEIHFSNIEEDGIWTGVKSTEALQKAAHQLKPDPSQPQYQPPPQYQITDNYHIKNQEDYNEALATGIYDEGVTKNMASSKHQDGENSPWESQNTEALDDKSLYIIINVPEKPSQVSASDSLKELKNLNPSYMENEIAAVRSSPTKNQSVKLAKAKAEKLRKPNILQKGRSKSLPKEVKLLSKKQDEMKNSDSKMRFEVHELDDAATYIFHLRFNRKPSSVGYVPEKDVNTRSNNFSSQDAPMQISNSLKDVTGKSSKNHKKQTLIYDTPEAVRHFTSKNAQQKSTANTENLDENKSKFYGAARNYHNTTSANMNEVSGESFNKAEFSETYASESLSPPEETYAVGYEQQAAVGSTAYESMQNYQWSTQEYAQDNTPVQTQSYTEYSTNYADPNGNYKNPEVETQVQVESTDRMRDYYNQQYYTDQYQLVDSEPTPETMTQSNENKPEASKTKIGSSQKRGVKNTTFNGGWTDKKKLKAGPLAESQFHSDSKISQGPISQRDEKIESDITDFKTSPNKINIKTEKNIPRFSAAFPPTLNEALLRRGSKFASRDSIFNKKWSSRHDFGPKNFELNPNCLRSTKEMHLSENCFLFPMKSVDTESLLNERKSMILNVVKCGEESCQKISDNMVNVANDDFTDKGKSSLDSLTIMKKVKEIIDLDLNNAIKIFDRRGEEEGDSEATKSVVMLNGNNWEIDNERLEKCIQAQKAELEKEINSSEFQFVENEFGKKEETNLGDEVFIPKHLPAMKEKETEMKLEDDRLESVVTYNPSKNEFFINEEELCEAIQRRSAEPFVINAIQKLEEVLKDGKVCDSMFDSPTLLALKNGDSILIFDEETQTWKVDYSILERRERQLREEQELTKRSELILETFEKLEQNQIPNVPKPNSRETKIFDYNTEEWKVYHPEKKTSNSCPQQKSTKIKFPFKESNAEEIRKKNSDLYEDLFLAKRKQEKIGKDGKLSKDAPGVNSTTKKETKTYRASSKKEEGSGSKESETVKRNVEESPEDTQNQIYMKMKKDEKNGPVDSSANKNTKLSSASSKKEAEGSGSKQSETAESKIKQPPKGTPKPFRKPSKEKLPDTRKEDDNFWESFLKMGILPRQISEIPKKKVPPPPPTPPPPQRKKIEDPAPKVPPKRIEEPKFKIPIPFMGDKKKNEVKQKEPPKGDKKPTDSLGKPPPPTGAEKKEDPKSKAPPPQTPQVQVDPNKNKSPSIGSSKSAEPKAPTSGSTNAKSTQDQKLGHIQTPPGDKKDKTAADHYISDNIVEMSRNTKEKKLKSNKIETVKLNITSDERVPSKVTEINLNKKCEVKEPPKETNEPRKSTETTKKPEKYSTITKSSLENKTFYKNFDKYKSPFSDPEYEEKTMKINSDMENNPNLKKLDNWNKTLVLHNVPKPAENIESWLKDETDKMATLLLKVLQEAADGKPKRKPIPGKSKSCEKISSKPNPYDNIRKKQETNSEHFLFKVQSVNVAFDTGKNKSGDGAQKQEQPPLKDLSGHPAKTAKPGNVVGIVKMTTTCLHPTTKSSQEILAQGGLNESKSKAPDVMGDPLLAPKEIGQPRVVTELTEDIPGPEFLKKISKVWNFFPSISAQFTIFTLLRIFKLVGAPFFSSTSSDKNKKNAFNKLFTKYGPIVNLRGPLSGNVILIHKPEHLSGVFEQDTTVPVRSVFDSLEQARRDSEDKVQSAAIFTDWSKPEWVDLKKALNDPLVKGCEKFFGAVELAGDSLVSTIRRNRNGQNLVSDDFMEEIKRWSMEGLCNVLFEKSFHFLEGRSSSLSWLLETDKLYMAIDNATDCLSKCERGFQTWRLTSTPSSIGLTQAYRSLSGILSKHIYQAELSLKNKNEILKFGSLRNLQDMTFVESMLLNDGMTMDEVTCNLIDIMLIGINSMSSALGFLLYNLAENVKIQEKLLKEIKETLPDKQTRLDYHKLHSLKYLQACVKESLRMHMPVSKFFRVLQNDIVLSNYVVPKGTYVVMDPRVSCMKEQIFDEPDKFSPERWMNDEKLLQNIHPLSFFPFCHGPRTDLAKRVVEMQLWSSVAKVIRNFKIEYHFGEIQGTENIISFPDKPLKLNFIEREE